MDFPKLKSRNGTAVILYTRKAGGRFPVHGAYYAGNEEWIPHSWAADGKIISVRTNPLDIDLALRELDASDEATTS